MPKSTSVPPQPEYHEYLAWDAPTRWFHWINALAVLGLIGTGLVILSGNSLGLSTEGKPFVEIHEITFYVLAIAVVLHLAAVVVTEIHEGGGITSAMFTGRKILTRKPPDAP